ncbi:MAG: hypothetical protein HYV19_13110 [Gemmatimonadetes bacterium]|nr:hypothetical protein [Gemmatimonadota bacterium]
MNSRRLVPLALAAVVGVSVACLESTRAKSVPFGFLTLGAQQAGAGYATAPVGSFFNAGGLGVPSTAAPWDSCRQENYSRSTVGLGDVYPSINAGSAIEVRLTGRTDSLFPIAVGNAVQYLLKGAALPYVPGDTVSVVIPGTSDGYPAVSFKAKTAEVLTLTPFVAPAAGSGLDLRWNAGQDLNGAIAVSFRYGALSADTLNAQIYCQLKDDGAGSIPARYMDAWTQATVKSWTISRVRTYVAPVARGGYFDFISTFDLPTP